MEKITKAGKSSKGLFFPSNLPIIRYLIGLALCVAGFGSTVAAAPSTLDPFFGNSGKVVSSPDGSQSALGGAMALQTDGKIVMVGIKLQSPVGILAARYNSNGTLDSTFGNNGWSFAAFENVVDGATSVDIQPDGKIVAGLTIQNVEQSQNPHDFALVRFNANGSIDTTFDGDGKVIIDFNGLLNGFHREYFSVLKIGNDGKIIAAGNSIAPAFENRFVFVRLNPDGSPDSTVGNNGRIVDLSRGSSVIQINDMVILPDGNFVAAGKINGNTGSYRIAIKYRTNGTKEWTYLAGTPSNMPNEADGLNGIAALPDGKFIVVGKRLFKLVALRLNADGTEDNTFNSPTTLPEGQAHSVAVQANGKIVATMQNGLFSLVRFNANGSLDTAFGDGGFVQTSVSGGLDVTKKIIIQPDGKYLVGGSSQIDSQNGSFFSMTRYLGALALNNSRLFDYDGDSRADISVFRPSENKWYILLSSNSSLRENIFGLAGDIPTPADFDGDGKADIAIFRPSAGAWWYLSSVNGQQVNVNFGQNGDIPRPSDFDGDGKTDFVVYRPSNSVWYRMSATGQVAAPFAFGIAEDKPLIADFDGDGKSEPAIFRPSTGDWWYAPSSSVNGQFAVVHWGAAGDVPVPADVDADGKTDFVIYRPSNGGWYILRSGEQNYTILQFGIAEDKPVMADYDGDGKADVAVFRPSNGTWYLLQTTSGFGAAQWGTSADIATPNAFLP